MINTEQIENFLGVEKSNCPICKYGDGRTPYDHYSNGFGDGKGEGHGMQYSDGYGLDNGYGIAEIDGYKVYNIDYIPTIITAIHGNIAQGFILRRNTQFESCFIVKGNDQFAHGKTLHEAYEALQGKLFTNSTEEERIKAFIEKFPEYDTPYSNKDFYIYHNRLTGSCKMGRLAFKDSNELSLDGTMTVRQFIALTEDAYQGDIIKKLPKAYKEAGKRI